jgi:hypothetical protein
MTVVRTLEYSREISRPREDMSLDTPQLIPLPRPHRFSILVHCIQRAKLETRVEILKCIRVGDTWSANSFLNSNLTLLNSTDVFDSLCYHPPFSTPVPIETFEEQLSDAIRYLGYSSYISMCLRSLPLDTLRWQNVEDFVRITSFWKEFKTTQEFRAPPQINYDAIFSRAVSTWHPDVEVRPELQLDIFTRLTSWKNKLSGRVIYPKYSKKTMGVESSYRLGQDMFSEEFTRGTKLSTRDWERHYHYTGREVDGPVEMRQAWFFNDLKPRTYFANGGTTYRWSRYMQPIFNALLDIFPMTHRFSRFKLHRLRFSPDAKVVVHDYSDFTSRMAEQVYFLDALARFCHGTTVTVLDTHYGLVECDLGDLIQEYNNGCNKEASFRISEALLELTGIADAEYFHMVAGFLGVYANLASCTALHGIHLCLSCGSYNRCSCVGDDALSAYEVTTVVNAEEGEIHIEGASRSVIFQNLRILGRIAGSKTKWFDPIIEVDWDSHKWSYLKRSLERYEDELLLGRLEDYPSYAIAAYDVIHTSRKLNIPLDDDVVRSKLASMAFSAVRNQYARHTTTSEGEVHLLYDYLRSIYRRYRLPFQGHLFGARGQSVASDQHLLEGITILPAIPRYREGDMAMARSNPVTELVKSLRLDGWEAPCVVERGHVNEFAAEVGDNFRSVGKRPLSILEDLGYLSKTVEIRSITGIDIALELERFLDRRTSILYNYTIVRSVPSWYHDLHLRGEV